MFSVENRTTSIPKYVFREQNQQTNDIIRAQRKEAVKKLINKRNPTYETETNKTHERLKRCTEGIKNSFLSDFSKIYKRFILWPFVPRLKTSESIDNGGRLVIFLCLSLILTLFFYPKIPDQFKITTDSVGFTIALLIFIIPNITYYFTAKYILKRCISNTNSIIEKIEESIGDEGTKIENELRGRGLEGLMRDKHDNYIQEEYKVREPMRIDMPFHPTIPDIL